MDRNKITPEGLHEDLDASIDALHRANTADGKQVTAEEDVRDWEIPRSSFQRIFRRSQAQPKLLDLSELKDEPVSPKPGRAALKLSLSTLLILMILGIAFMQDGDSRFGGGLQEALLPTDNTRDHLVTAGQDDEPATPVIGGVDQSEQEALPVDLAPLDPQDEADETEPARTTSPATSTSTSPATSTSTTEPTAVQPSQSSSELSVPTFAELTWQVPTDSSVLRSFGYSFDPTWNDYRFHSGVDLAYDEGAQVQIPAAATVIELGKSKALGEYIRLDFGNGLVGCYYGLAVAPDLSTGSSLEGGMVIGNVTASPLQEQNEDSHLHFELRQEGQAVDPMLFLEQ